MCLVVFAWQAHPSFPLVLAANRDEFRGRPTAPAAPWADALEVVAGRDLREGGTWLGVARGGRWAALTNFHEPPAARPTGAPSRGHLVADFLRGRWTPAEYLAEVAPRAAGYSGFNLLVGDVDSVFWLSNRGDAGPVRLTPGIHGVSNHLLNTPWPKVERGKREMERLVAGEPRADELLDLLLDRTLVVDREREPPRDDPGTGHERARSAIFIRGAEYGTRSSSAVLIRPRGGALLVERTYALAAPGWTEVRHEI